MSEHIRKDAISNGWMDWIYQGTGRYRTSYGAGAGGEVLKYCALF